MVMDMNNQLWYTTGTSLIIVLLALVWYLTDRKSLYRFFMRFLLKPMLQIPWLRTLILRRIQQRFELRTE